MRRIKKAVSSEGQKPVKWRRFQRYLSREIAIEFKSGLYFLCFMFYYGAYRWAMGCRTGELIPMMEMLAVVYLVCYVQVYLLGNFDEAERYGLREWAGALLCSGLYGGAAWLFGWFGGGAAVTVGFFFYTLVCHLCMFAICKIKRVIDTKHLNQELESFKARRKEE